VAEQLRSGVNARMTKIPCRIRSSRSLCGPIKTVGFRSGFKFNSLARTDVRELGQKARKAPLCLRHSGEASQIIDAQPLPSFPKSVRLGRNGFGKVRNMAFIVFPCLAAHFSCSLNERKSLSSCAAFSEGRLWISFNKKTACRISASCFFSKRFKVYCKYYARI